ncbi:MAG: hypothetical protein R3263_05740 [Myxococcota bacterium]|nr:hypothetical protein [Myxococcota bacterium]
MKLLVLLATLSFILVGGMVGAKLLLLARRTRQLPELTMGLGVFLVAFVGYPLSLASISPDLAPLPAKLLFAAGSLASAVGSASFYVFTWKVFRPEAGWARALALTAIVAIFTFAVISVARVAGAAGPAEIFRDRLSVVRNVVTGFSYLWTAVEGLRYYALLRRRLALGLADPVVANRFLLWGVSGVSATLGISVSTAMILLGDAGAGMHPVSMLVVGVAGLTSSVTLYLAFLPPAAWLRFVTRGAGASGSPA